MHETEDDLSALQDLLDRSFAAVGQHLLEVITPENRMTAPCEVCDRLQGVRLLARPPPPPTVDPRRTGGRGVLPRIVPLQLVTGLAADPASASPAPGKRHPRSRGVVCRHRARRGDADQPHRAAGRQPAGDVAGPLRPPYGPEWSSSSTPTSAPGSRPGGCSSSTCRSSPSCSRRRRLLGCQWRRPDRGRGRGR